MIPRTIEDKLKSALSREASVALIGARQVGKTTLALKIADGRPSVYLDLENRNDRDKLIDAITYFNIHQDKLIVLDEIHRTPNIFETLRGLIDEGRRIGKANCRFLILGSAIIDLMRQSESLAGRIEYINLRPFHYLETKDKFSLEDLWLRGGFPRSLIAEDDNESFIWRQNFIQTYLERDVPMFGPRIPAQTMERLWIMISNSQGNLLNASKFARNLSLSSPSISTYIDLLCDLLLVRRLPPFFTNINKRLIKSPKIYVRDSGLLHALLGIETIDELLAHPVVGNSWEGFVIENILAVAPNRTRASFYRTARGAEIDLILELGPKYGIWAIEIKRNPAAKTTKGFTIALNDIKPNKAFIVHSGKDRYPRGNNTEAISLIDLMLELSKL